jgi:hypothetical protein
VADQRVGPHTPGAPQLGQRILDGEQRRLGVGGLVEPARTILGEQQFAQWHAEQRIEHRGAAVQRRAEHRLSLVEPSGHAGVLRALPGEHEGHPRGIAPRRAALAHAVAVAPVGQRQQSLAQGGDRSGAHGGSVLQVSAPDRRARAHVGQCVVAQPFEGRCITSSLGGQRNIAVCRQHEQERATRCRGAGWRLLCRCRLDHHMHVGAAETERADAADAPAADRLPRGQRHRHLDRHFIPRDVRARLAEVQVRRNGTMLQRQRELDQPGDASGRFEVADVGLDGADPQRLARMARRPEHVAQRAHFERIAQFGAGAMGLDEAHFAGGHAGALERGTDHGLLRRAVRCGEARTRTVLVDRATQDDGQDAVAIGARIGQPLEHHDATAFAARETVGGGIEGLAAAVGGQHARVRQRDVQLGRQDQVDAAGQRQPAVAATQRLARQMHRHQRRRTRGVDRQCRPLQSEQVRQPARHDAVRDARCEVRIEQRFVAAVELQVGIVAAGHADVHAGGRTLQAVGCLAGVLERFPRDLEQQALLRVHALRFAARDAEQRRIEAAHVAEEAAAAGGDAPWCTGVGVVQRIDIPAVARQRSDGIDTVAHQRPEAARVVAAAGHSAADADDRHRLARCALGGCQASPHVLQCEEGALQRRHAGVGVIAHRSPQRSSSRRLMSSSLIAATSAAFIGGVGDTAVAAVAGAGGAAGFSRCSRCEAMASMVG